MTTSAKTERKPSRSVLRALAVLEAIASGATGPSAIAAELGVSKGTVFDLLRTLVSAGYVRQEPSSDQYRLGPALVRLTAKGSASPGLLEIAAAHLQKLSDDTREVVHLGQRSGFGSAYLHRSNTERQGRRLSLNSLVGSISPFHCTSMGKVFMAHLPEAEFETYLLQERESFTDRTICDPEELRIERTRTLERGYGLNIGEYEEGVSSVAVPLRLDGATGTYGINFAMPSVRMPETSISGFVERLRSTASAIENAMETI